MNTNILRDNKIFGIGQNKIEDYTSICQHVPIVYKSHLCGTEKHDHDALHEIICHVGYNQSIMKLILTTKYIF